MARHENTTPRTTATIKTTAPSLHIYTYKWEKGRTPMRGGGACCLSLVMAVGMGNTTGLKVLVVARA